MERRRKKLTSYASQEEHEGKKEVINLTLVAVPSLGGGDKQEIKEHRNYNIVKMMPLLKGGNRDPLICPQLKNQ